MFHMNLVNNFLALFHNFFRADAESCLRGSGDGFPVHRGEQRQMMARNAFPTAPARLRAHPIRSDTRQKKSHPEGWLIGEINGVT